MDEKNEMNGTSPEENSAGGERNTNAPTGWSYSANTNQYKTYEGSSAKSGAEQQNQGYTSQNYYSGQTNYYSNSGANPYGNNNGYQWDFNRYESASAQKPPKKKSSGKGFKVFLGIIAAVLGCCVIALAAFGIMSLTGGFKKTPAGSNPGSSYSQSQADTQTKNETPPLSLQGKPDSGSAVVSTDGKLSATEVYKQVSPSVVGVVVYQYSKSFEPLGEGSGIIISADGYILTNAHVVKGAEAIKVVLYNEEEYEARLIGSDEQTDIAVLKIDESNLTAAELGDSAEIEVGETVYAIGNPGGIALHSSFTDGIVSGLNRVITTQDSSYAMTVIQTNAAINPGNSGGALVNEYGQVIGITSSKLADVDYEGIGFAIPTASAIPIAQEIIENGYVSGRAMLGITGKSIDSVEARYYSVPLGVQIVTINSDGAFAGTEAAVGDIITRFGTTEITSMEDLQSCLANSEPGDTVEVTLYRYSATKNNDRTFTVTVTLIENRG